MNEPSATLVHGQSSAIRMRVLKSITWSLFLAQLVLMFFLVRSFGNVVDHYYDRIDVGSDMLGAFRFYTFEQAELLSLMTDKDKTRKDQLRATHERRRKMELDRAVRLNGRVLLNDHAELVPLEQDWWEQVAEPSLKVRDAYVSGKITYADMLQRTAGMEQSGWQQRYALAINRMYEHSRNNAKPSEDSDLNRYLVFYWAVFTSCVLLFLISIYVRHLASQHV